MTGSRKCKRLRPSRRVCYGGLWIGAASTAERIRAKFRCMASHRTRCVPCSRSPGSPAIAAATALTIADMLDVTQVRASSPEEMRGSRSSRL